MAVPSAILAVSNNPAGRWTDSRYGGNFSICQTRHRASANLNDPQFYSGVYSGTGVVRGSFSTTGLFTGNWYEPGVNRTVDGVVMPNWGTFSLQFTRTNDNLGSESYSGTYSYYGSSTSIAWSGRLVVRSPIRPLECFDSTFHDGVGATDQHTGKFLLLGGDLFIKEEDERSNDNTYNASWSTPAGVTMYMEGVCNDSDQVCRGQWLREDAYGQALFSIGKPTARSQTVLIYMISFTGSFNEGSADYIDVPAQIASTGTDPTLYFTAAGERVATSVTDEEATSNQVMLLQGTFEVAGTPEGPNPCEGPVDSLYNSLASGTTVSSDPGANRVYMLYKGYIVYRGTYDWASRTLSGMYFGPGYQWCNQSSTAGHFSLSIGFGDEWLGVSGSFTSSSMAYPDVEVAQYTGSLTFSRTGWARASDEECLFNTATTEMDDLSGEWLGDVSLSLYSVNVGTPDANGVSQVNVSATVPGLGSIFVQGVCYPMYGVCSISFSSGSVTAIGFLLQTGDGLTRLLGWLSSCPGGDGNAGLPRVACLSEGLTYNGPTTPEDAYRNNYLVFQGRWLDQIYGETLYITGNSTYLFGAYSEAGVFRGTYDASTLTWTGRWYEVGSYYTSPSELTSGDFQITAKTFFHMSASLQFDSGEPSVSYEYDTFIPEDAPVDPALESWANTANSAVVLGGVYGFGLDLLHICLQDLSDEPNYIASWSTNDGLRGYSEGNCNSALKVCHGRYWQNKNVLFGNTLFTLIRDGTVQPLDTCLTSSWSGPWTASMVSSQFNDESLHVVATRPRLAYVAVKSKCEENADLRAIDTNDSDSDDTSASHSAKVLPLGFAVIIALLFGL